MENPLSGLFGKKFSIKTDGTKPDPNPKLLKQIKRYKTGHVTKEEFIAKKQYLDELRERERYND